MPIPLTAAVNLDNCDREPIHIPGHVQTHGALLVFDDGGALLAASRNAPLVLGDLQAVRHAVSAACAAAVPGVPQQHELRLGDRLLDLIVHRSGGQVVAEFEPRDPGAQDPGAFAVSAHRSLDRLRRQGSVQALLEAAVVEVRALTGFDRVMAYRFRHDASGDVVAEALAEGLDPFLHRRYPAGDIPAQARRLYVVNTLRLIADVQAPVVPVEGALTGPLDMSHCVLRSVSPVHIEYLTNMRVRASMSVSIVVGGQLWGMLACHHMAPRHVPYAVRMACDVLAHVLAANVQGLLAAEQAVHLGRASTVRSRMVQQLLHAEDALAALPPLAAELEQVLEAGATVVAEGARLVVHGGLPAGAGRALLEWLPTRLDLLEGGILALHTLTDLPPALTAALGGWCGLLAMRFDEVAGGWLVLLRREQIETIAWGGRPEKHYVNGPLGPRLTPRGSFDVWRETVRGTTVPWSAGDLQIARQLLDDLARASAARHAELSRGRDQLLAVLGHDLRNPLQTISMTAHVLERGADGVKMGRRLQSASGRMERLIAQVLDMSRLQSGLGLGFAFARTDLAALVDNLIADESIAHPGTQFVRSLPDRLEADADPDRLAQLLGNLLSNARHHGDADRPVSLRLLSDGRDAVLEVANHAPPIPADMLAQLFAPFKRQSVGNRYNKGGLGLGLYIAREIARGHGGTLASTYAAQQVVFTLRFPLRRPPPA